MELYKDFQPTGFDSRGLAGDRHNINNYLVLPCGRNRDSGDLDESNFHTALEILGGESDSVQVHRFGHWGCGWFELILVDSTDADKVAIAETIEATLSEYPVLDDSDFSEREYNSACDYWARASVRDRAEYLKLAGQNIFAARRDELPRDDNGRLLELITRNY